MNVELQRSKHVHPFCTHIDKIKPFEAEAMPISWLQDAVGNTSQIGTDVDASSECTPDEDVGDMVRTQQGLPGSSNPQNLDGASLTNDAIAGAPPIDFRTPRPRRLIRHPRRYLES